MCENEQKITGETSDGNHTFNELYYYRMLYNAALFNEWAYSHRFHVMKSKKHSDGELCFGGGWFVVVAFVPGGQITNHYEMKHWGMFKIPEVVMAPAWDGHTPAQAAKRLKDYISMQMGYDEV